jgi:class 3 adenylate cyclase
MRLSTDQEAIMGFYDARGRESVAPLLSTVGAPTLVLYRPGSESFDELRGLAADVPIAEDALLRLRDLPNAMLVPLDSEVVAPYLSEQTTSLIEDFLGDGSSLSRDPAQAHSGTAIILFADIADSTALTERLGDDEFRERQRALDATLRTIVADEDGTSVAGRTLGDGVLAQFASARSAIRAAVRCVEAGNECSMRLHLGVHAGDVIREEHNVWGGAVNIAARICALAEPGEVLVSDVVRALARTSASVTFDDRGEVELRGIDEPQRVFAVRSLG